MPSPDNSAPVAYEVVLEAGRAEKHYWADLWRYREPSGVHPGNRGS